MADALLYNKLFKCLYSTSTPLPQSVSDIGYLGFTECADSRPWVLCSCADVQHKWLLYVTRETLPAGVGKLQEIVLMLQHDQSQAEGGPSVCDTETLATKQTCGPNNPSELNGFRCCDLRHDTDAIQLRKSNNSFNERERE